ncbi:DUF3304 domain-containing protein [Marinobacter oulmenensis]|uniref:DUF3304 domain-containing protein n=1 Tax=Marinobacter oulmenensis TaxID=643747 RepID=A0A840UGG8_9GAMM|nr:DUF3304 domain-containing protein [Marinobacter oulmenensis]MBB5322580.1 hypothetical protein [Marinobacter oulmenensis]
MHFNLRRIFAMVAILVLSGCGPSESGNAVTLNVTGVDYAGKGISAFAVEDPSNPENRGTGMSITPYSAGGIQCCYQVPEKWHEGMTVNVIVRYPLEGETTDERSANLAKRQAEGTVKHTISVNIPEYETPARGTLWVQFLPEKQAKVVVSDLDPPHEDFPGDVKGWPEPSDEYRRKIIDRDLQLVRERLGRNQEALDELSENPIETRKTYWGVFKRTRTKDLDQYSGPEDPQFHELLQNYLVRYIENDKKEIRILEEARP